MKLGYAALLSGLALAACSLGSTSPESEPTGASTSRPAPTHASSRPPGAAPPWTNVGDSRRHAASYKGKNCLGDRPTLVGTPGDDRIRATFGDDVIMTLGGNDVVVGPKGAAWRDLICTGAGDDQVFYGHGSYGDLLDSQIDLGRETTE